MKDSFLREASIFQPLKSSFFKKKGEKLSERKNFILFLYVALLSFQLRHDFERILLVN